MMPAGFFELAGVPVGAFAACAFERAARSTAELSRALAIFLAIVLLVYPIFAWHGGSLGALAIESAPIALAARFWARFKHGSNMRWLSIAFLVHAAWDVLHHEHTFPAVVPAPYPLFCALLDMTVFSWLASRRYWSNAVA
jgi:hypothetical protein